jgi:hypothetical protein
MQLYNARLTTLATAAAGMLESTHRIRQARRNSLERVTFIHGSRPVDSSVGGHEDRKAEAGQMVQRLIDADQGPEPWVLVLLRDAESGGAKSLRAIDADMDREVDHGDEPETRRDDQDQHQRNYKVYETVRQQRQRPALLLILSDRHPGILKDEIGDEVLDGEQQHPSDQRSDRNGG